MTALSHPTKRRGADPALFSSRQDIITDDELISDSYDLKEVDGIVYEADCAMITEGGVEVGSFTPVFLRMGNVARPRGKGKICEGESFADW